MLSVLGHTLLGVIAGIYLTLVSAKASGVVLNFTRSAARGVYLQTSESLRTGALVGVCLEGSALETAKTRNYILPGECPSGLQPIIKQVLAASGAEVEVTPRSVFVNGREVVRERLKLTDSGSRVLTNAIGKHVLAENELFLLSLNPECGWDSRYFGPVKTSTVISVIKPVFLF